MFFSRHKHAFPLRQDILAKITADIKYNDYTRPEAIVKHLCQVSKTDAPGFVKLVYDRFRKIDQEQMHEFFDGYLKLLYLLQLADMFVSKGSYAAEVAMSRSNISHDDSVFLFISLPAATPLIEKDRSGRTLVKNFTNTFSEQEKRYYFKEGMKTFCDTFLMYLEAVESDFKSFSK